MADLLIHGVIRVRCGHVSKGACRVCITRDLVDPLDKRLEAAEDDVALLTKALQDAIDGKVGWDLSAKAMVQPINRMVDRMRRAGATPKEAKAAFDAALAAGEEP